MPGTYTVAVTPGHTILPTARYPQGDGFGLLTVSKLGTVRLVGTLADGTPITCSNSLSKDKSWPFYVALAAGKGSISGPVLFADIAATSDLSGAALQWFKPAVTGAKYYPLGWETGLETHLVGCKLVIPTVAANTSVLPGLSAPIMGGNAGVELADGNLATLINKAVNVSTSDLVTVTAVTAEQLVFKLRSGAGGQLDQHVLSQHAAPPNGLFTGTFIHPLTHKSVRFKGAILQKQHLGTGFFLGSSESGSASIAPSH